MRILPIYLNNMKILIADLLDPVFGKITPPKSVTQFAGSDPTGERGISFILSNLISLFYTAAAVVLVFMFLWGAYDWMTSEGEKEKIQSAQRKILNAMIGIIIFAAAFGVFQILGEFSGFKFFEGQK